MQLNHLKISAATALAGISLAGSTLVGVPFANASPSTTASTTQAAGDTIQTCSQAPFCATYISGELDPNGAIGVQDYPRGYNFSDNGGADAPGSGMAVPD